MKTYKNVGLMALTLGLVAMANLSFAGEERTWDGHAQEDASHYQNSGAAASGSNTAWPINKTWDGKGQDDATHFQHKAVEGRYGGVVVGEARDTANNTGRTWNGRTQDEPANFRNGQGVYGRSAVYDTGNPIAQDAGCDMPCCKTMKMDKQDCAKMMGKGR